MRIWVLALRKLRNLLSDTRVTQGNKYFNLETEAAATKPAAAVPYNEQILSSW